MRKIMLCILLLLLVQILAGCSAAEHYIGETENGIPHGYGVMEYASGVKYAGSFSDGLFHGQGKWSHPNGSVFEGRFEKGKRYGYGVMLYPDGSKYEGNWNDNRKHGYGIFLYPDGSRYEGEWKDDRKHNQGTMYWPDGDVYEGDWDSGEIKTEPLIAITFDDGFESDFTIAYREMLNRGMLGTSYIYTAAIGSTIRLKEAQIRAMIENGWVFGCRTHTLVRLPGLTESEIHDQMQQVDQTFMDAGFLPPEHHSYPYGDHNETVRKIVGQYRKTMRGGAGFNTYQDIDFEKFSAIPADMQNRDDYDIVVGYIDTAIKNNYIIVLYFHRISSEAGSYRCQYALFIDLLDYIDKTGVRVVTIAELYDLVTEYPYHRN